MSADRLVPIEVLPMTRSVDEGRTRLRLRNWDGGDKEGEVTGQCIDGRIYVKFDGERAARIIDLSREDYIWLN